MLALPVLESIAPFGAKAMGAKSTLPVRLLFYYVPNGMHMPAFTPDSSGTNYVLPEILTPLENVRQELNVISGLANRAGEDNVPGDHARGTGSFLTCTRVVKTDGDGIQNGISVDRYRPKRWVTTTYHPCSLVLRVVQVSATVIRDIAAYAQYLVGGSEHSIG